MLMSYEMNNNEQILNNLIGHNGNQSPQNPNAVPTWTDDEVLITTARVVSIRYKVYVVLVALCMFIVYQYLLVPLYDDIKWKTVELDHIKLEIAQMEAKEKEYEENRALVDQIAELDPIITSCVNEWEGCKEVPEILRENDNFSIARSYLLLWDMTAEKMDINEKKIIKNIDSFLLTNFWDEDNSDSETMLSKNHKDDIDESDKSDNTDEWEDSEDSENTENSEESTATQWQNPKVEDTDSEKVDSEEEWDETWDEDTENNDEDEDEDSSRENFSLGEKNGTINKIVIWDKERFNETLYYVPIELTITFDNKDWLLSFINNVEKRVPEDQDLRLLYKISKITYDVVNYDQPQETVINMNLYYYEK